MKIGGILGALPRVSSGSNKSSQKFIIVRENDDLVYYAHEINFSITFHPDILKVKKFKIPTGVSVIGGGHITHHDDGTVSFWGSSTNYGAVPEGIMKDFFPLIEEKYKARYPSIRKCILVNKKSD